MEILVDTFVWVDHFWQRNETLVNLLALDLALSHPMVQIELACGTPLPPRVRALSDIAMLPQTRQASLSEVTDLIERERLFGLGCGLVDLTLLASTLLTPESRLWSLDRRLV